MPIKIKIIIILFNCTHIRLRSTPQHARSAVYLFVYLSSLTLHELTGWNGKFSPCRVDPTEKFTNSLKVSIILVIINVPFGFVSKIRIDLLPHLLLMKNEQMNKKMAINLYINLQISYFSTASCMRIRHTLSITR